ncbi:MAG TPA: LLM class flavin-dependent oxidoreductase [Actinomycetota bacterium]|nr:LLM class flavin-dependent oxidoreductase [Actinomycetota bacterium]
MKLGLSLTVFTADPARPMAAADRAAANGYDAVFASDHLFPPGSPERPSLETYTLLSAIAAAHPGLGVGVLVTRAGFRPPGILAKQAAALDQLSGGRSILGLGLGDASGRAEHRALGLPYPPVAERGEALEETAAALRALFRGDTWPGGAHVPPLTGPLLPPGAPQVWVGGVSDRVLGIAARAADAWNAWGLEIEPFVARAEALAGLARAAGRDPAEVPPTWAGIALVAEDAAALDRLASERGEKGLTMDIWRGTVDDLRRLRDAVAAAGAGGTWLVVVAAGPADRAELIAATLRAG